jgi:predicted amidohydrolase YtcJ
MSLEDATVAVWSSPPLKRLAIVNTKVVTMIANQPPFEAIGIAGDRVVALGTTAQIREWANGGAVYDLGGRCVVPGFTDPHVHLENPTGYDRSLDDCASRAEVLATVRRRYEGTDDAWVFCSGLLSNTAYWPTAEELDVVTGNRPVVLSFSGAAYALNSAALGHVDWRAASADSAVIEVQPATGSPTGVLRTRGADRLHVILPDAPLTGLEAVERALLSGLNRLLRSGVTSVHHIVKEALPVNIYQALRREGRLPTRVGLLVRIFESDIALSSVLEMGLTQGFGDTMLKLQGVKVSVDGYFPHGGALFTEPYADAPGDCGRARITQEELDELVESAHRRGLRIAVHANGDHALNMTLQSYERAMSKQMRFDHRHRIEHAGNIYLPPRAIQRMAAMGLVAVVNPTFMHRLPQHLLGRLGSRRGSCPLAVRSMLDGGTTVAAGSDFAGLNPPDPMLGIAALVNRRSLSGEVYAPEEAITPLEALQIYTLQNAWLGFEEHERGALAPGMLADLVVLSGDPLSVPPEQIGEIDVLGTMVGGAWGWTSDTFSGWPMSLEAMTAPSAP